MIPVLATALAFALGYVLGRRRTRKDLNAEADKWAHLVSAQVLLEAQAKTLESFARVLGEQDADRFSIPVRVASMLAESYRDRAEQVGAGS